MMHIKRIQKVNSFYDYLDFLKELEKITEDPPEGYSFTPHDAFNLWHLKGFIFGPVNYMKAFSIMNRKILFIKEGSSH